MYKHHHAITAANEEQCKREEKNMKQHEYCTMIRARETIDGREERNKRKHEYHAREIYVRIYKKYLFIHLLPNLDPSNGTGLMVRAFQDNAIDVEITGGHNYDLYAAIL